jgi:hypothetical protein
LYWVTGIRFAQFYASLLCKARQHACAETGENSGFNWRSETSEEENRNMPDEEIGKDVEGAGEASLSAQSSSNDGSKARKGNREGENAVREEEEKLKDSLIKRAIEKIGLDVGTVMMMFKYVILVIGEREEEGVC